MQTRDFTKAAKPRKGRTLALAASCIVGLAATSKIVWDARFLNVSIDAARSMASSGSVGDRQNAARLIHIDTKASIVSLVSMAKNADADGQDARIYLRKIADLCITELQGVAAEPSPQGDHARECIDRLRQALR